ncbi:putative transport protein (MFS superfamily) [Xenorhabdus nematophila ATCC 19061]|uniref:Transport protein (MFS superfamily) n=1 Tax=Xenorhabdus nematophila (strain ATCC 19061 / DSM 3370 / CCUG 14189 / LMG 1036 / NCIMB 9965 / AN6) TaxID=406817 RepID=D3VAQ8_XENNA|nr:MFS transporter [Xenorhabdus nematophila]CBJ89494.1 putative transport protein (MFS superfamily) [Xenorhabdus nematophila ATCC 19061]CEK22387.1 putative transport protein (MFS superfamily) [Xenorhabdus nematophila AN6/1]
MAFGLFCLYKDSQLSQTTPSQKTLLQKGITKHRLLTIAGLGWMFDALDVGLLSFLLAALKQDWGLSAQQLGWIGSVNSIGMAVGAFVFGVMADKTGRKSAFIVTLLLFSIGSGLTALVSTLAALLVLRFIIGMGLGGELPVASTLVSESVEAHERGRIVVVLESFWAFGWLAAALIAYFIIPDYGWRVAMLLSALPALYAIYLRIHLPDSPRYTQMSAHKKRSSMMDNIRAVWSTDYRRATIMLWILWFCVVFSYYGMFLWLPSVMILKGFSLVKSFQYVLIMTLAQLPGYFTAAWLIERYGRKFVLVSYLVGTAVSAYFFGTADSMTQLLTFGILLSFFNLGAWGAIYAYTPEQYPTAIRATGAGIAAAVGRIGGILGPLMVGYLVTINTPISLTFALFCASILVAVMAVIWLGTETRQTELMS